MKKHELFSLLDQVDWAQGPKLSIAVTRSPHSMTRLDIELVASQIVLPAPWTSSGRTTRRLLSTAYKVDAATRKAEQYQRWLQDYRRTKLGGPQP